jgi:hypothetical protein
VIVKLLMYVSKSVHVRVYLYFKMIDYLLILTLLKKHSNHIDYTESNGTMIFE